MLSRFAFIKKVVCNLRVSKTLTPFNSKWSTIDILIYFSTKTFLASHKKSTYKKMFQVIKDNINGHGIFKGGCKERCRPKFWPFKLLHKALVQQKKIYTILYRLGC